MDLSPEKIFVVGLIALIVLGPERLPVVARTAGKMLAELRRLSASVQHEVTNITSEPGHVVNRTSDELGLTDIHRTIKGARSSLRAVVNEVVTGTVVQAPAAYPEGPGSGTQLVPGRSEPVAVATSVVLGSPDDASLN